MTLGLTAVVKTRKNPVAGYNMQGNALFLMGRQPRSQGSEQCPGDRAAFPAGPQKLDYLGLAELGQ